ncbi:MAG TPA: M14 family metallopeptidase [Bacteroidota bacterium]|nr:M14 family metallopeptidase [Bacteroidota bacterium]
MIASALNCILNSATSNCRNSGLRAVLPLFLLLVLPAALPSGLAARQKFQSPDGEFGFTMGADKKLIDWKQIDSYFRKVGAASGRVVVKELGKTTLGKPFLLAVISSEANIANLDRYQEIQRQLARPYTLSPADAAALVREGKAVVLITMNIHSTEIASSQESVELLYELATGNSPRVRDILDNVIVLLIPSLNPDGQQMVVDWYRKTLGTPAEGTSPPELYHHYAGHDNNRDWFMYNLVESRHTAKVLYRDWFPEIEYDQHQMGSTGPRLFIPPYEDPVNPNVAPELTAQVNLLGKYVVADLQSRGFRGVATGTVFNAYFEGTMSKTPLWHNRIGILSEAASVQIASPVFLPKGSLGGYGSELPENKPQTNYLDPWEGGWWRLRDIIEYEKAATYALLQFASEFRERIKTNYYELNRKAIQAGATAAPYGYFIPAGQADPNAASEMLNRLLIAGVKVEKLAADIAIDGRAIPAGSYYVSFSQPERAYVKDLFEKQKYPNLKQYPGGPPKQPYDITAWTLPLQMGVEAIRQDNPMTVPTLAVDTVVVAGSVDPGKGTYRALDRRHGNSFAVAQELLGNPTPVYEASDSVRTAGPVLPPGAFLVRSDALQSADADALARRWGVRFESVDDVPADRLLNISAARAAIYQPWMTSMDEGWTRLVMDEFGVKYTVLKNPDIASKKADLRKRFDVIILPDMGTNQIVKGRWGSGDDDGPVLGTPERPKEYRGGIGDDGVDALTEFVNDGGTLLTLGESSQFAIDKLRLPARDELKGLSGNAFYGPGTILGMSVNTGNPLAFGMPAEANAYFTGGQAFRLLLYTGESRIVATYGEDDVLKSGWLVGEEKIAGKVAMAEIPVGRGRVVMYGFRVQHRAQTRGTFKLFLNALLVRDRTGP